jgi:hypothetical protein
MEDLYDFEEELDALLDEKKKKKQQKGKKRASKVAARKKKKKAKRDACYHKVRARYDVWPSAYASGALVKCRKVGAKNWGNKSKKKEGLEIDDHLLQIIHEEYNAVLEERKLSKKDNERIKEIVGQLENSVKKHRSQADFLKSLIEEEIEEALTEKKKKRKKRKGRKKAGSESSKESSLRDWFKRKGAPGKKGGWVDCNTCRKGKCKPCGRSGGEKRSKYPSCRPTPAACKERGRGKSWGKKTAKGKKG